MRGAPAVRLTIATILLLSACASASADFQVCNQTDVKVDVSIGYLDAETGWTSRGWWPLPVGGCARVLAGSLTSQYYYVYATGEGGKRWDAQKGQAGGFFCVTPKKFTVPVSDHETDRVLNCEKGGLMTRQFAVIDVGRERSNFTHTLTSRDGPVRTGVVAPPGAAPTGAAPPGAAPPSRPPAVTSAPPARPAAPAAPAGSACQRFPNLC